MDNNINFKVKIEERTDSYGTIIIDKSFSVIGDNFLLNMSLQESKDYDFTEMFEYIKTKLEEMVCIKK